MRGVMSIGSLGAERYVRYSSLRTRRNCGLRRSGAKADPSSMHNHLSCGQREAKSIGGDERSIELLYVVIYTYN